MAKNLQEKLGKKRCERCSKFNPVADSICNWCDKPVVKAVKAVKAAPKKVAAAPKSKPAVKATPATRSDSLGIGGPVTKERCPHCTRFNPTGDQICNWCDKPTRGGKESVLVQANATVGEKWKCEHCWTYNFPGVDKICRRCGTPPAAVVPVKPAALPPGDLYFDPVTETLRTVKPAGGQHGPTPTVTEAEMNRLVRPAFKPTASRLVEVDGAKPVVVPVKPAPTPTPTTVYAPSPSWMPKEQSAAARTAPHLVLVARAGCGKTTTLIGGTQKMQGLTPRDARGNPMTPSDQQRVIWDSLALSAGVQTIGLTSFSNTIVDELKERVRGTTVAAFTLHQYGFAAVRRALFRGVRLDKDGGMIKFMLADMMGEKLDRELYKKKGAMIEAVNSLVSHCKTNLCDPTAENIDALASHFDIEINQRDRAEIYNYVPALLNKCRDNMKPGAWMMFDDMIWLPVVLNLPVDRFDVLMVDEAQDLNRCQHALARRAVGDTGRLIFCGDPRQAIFGFAGADAKSMERLEKELAATDRKVEVLKLTKTRRCGKAIVERAKEVVPDFEAFDTNPMGAITSMKYADGEGNYRKAVQSGDMVLCRVNAPLVSQCFKFLREGVTAIILGRSVGDKLAKLVRGFDAVTVVDLVRKLEDWFRLETEKENARRMPDENKLINLQDNFDCLMCFTEGVEFVSQVLEKIDALFTNDRKANAVKLASIHKSKGLEAHRVFFINTEKASCPHPMAKSEWAVEQEWNLWYVATTRAINELVCVA